MEKRAGEFSMAELVITIDGPAASGKSTVARLLADRLGVTFLDTGAMYRAVTLAGVREGVDLTDEGQLLQVLGRHRFDFEIACGRMVVWVDGEDVTDAIRDNDLTAKVRYIASAPLVRQGLVEMQRAFAARHRRIVTEGRDQGTVAFPDADVKFYLTADAAERARRRKAELDAKGVDADLEQIWQAIEARDRSDENRAIGPLKPAADAVIVDTTGLSIHEAVDRVYHRLRGRADAAGREMWHSHPRGGPIPGPTGWPRHGGWATHRLKAAWYRTAQIGCWMICAIVFRIRVYGRENVPEEGAFILASNHQSFLDPVFCGVGLKRHLSFVARDSLFRFKPFTWLIRSLNAMPIGRGRPDVSAIKAIITRLRQGEGVCLYPEATRTYDGRIVPFKPGFGLLCRRAKAAVVPTLIDGAFECWPRHRRIFSPGPVTVCYGKALPPEQTRAMTNEQLADHLTHTLRQMQHETRLRQGKEPYDYDT